MLYLIQRYNNSRLCLIERTRVCMTFDFDKLSPAFKEFYEAFSPLTYGRSMGRAADQAAYMYDDFSDDEKALVNEWFLELLQQDTSYWGIQYLWVIEKTNDPRFVPLLEQYCRRLKEQQKQPIKTELNGEIVTMRPNYRSEIQLCKNVIRALKRG